MPVSEMPAHLCRLARIQVQMEDWTWLASCLLEQYGFRLGELFA